MLGHYIGTDGKFKAARGGTVARRHEAVIPGTDFANGISTGIYVGTGGNVSVTVGGVTLTYSNVPTGFILPAEASQVATTGTTASNMIAMFE